MPQPNVLLVCVDQWPGRLLSCAGHPTVMTPTLDQLADNGVRFTNAYSATPTCIPARRGLMTGTCARTHGDRVFNGRLEMPNLPTLAQVFTQAGYQSYAVGKMHVYPQRDRVGFGDVILNEEGRGKHSYDGGADDYELFLADQGYPGQELTHAMCNNDYLTRPWHLPEHCHPTNWTAAHMCRTIKRRNPSQPSFWYMSFNYPHPPLTPLAEYMDMYRDLEIPDPFIGDWAANFDQLPYALKLRYDRSAIQGDAAVQGGAVLRMARQAFYALCTHIDHQMRLVIGMLAEEKLLDNTIIMFTCDHGDMLGNHNLFAKAVFYEDSAKIPMILVPPVGHDRVGHHLVDDRLVELCDVMPTLLDLAGVPIPDTVEGTSLAGSQSRDYLYGEHYENFSATRMIRNARHKLIYYPLGNHLQLFDMQQDPDELRNLAQDPRHAEVRDTLVEQLIKRMYNDDLKWVDNGKLIGAPDIQYQSEPNRHLAGQRGWRFI